MIAFDHLVVAARTLEEGAAWVEARLGVAPVPGGKHAVMGTHNRLLHLGDRRFLEVIAIDPGAPDPGRLRWFSLDDPGMRARLEAGPALIHWVAAVGDIGKATARSPFPAGEVLELERGDYRWRITVPVDGKLTAGGAWPTLIEWRGDRHPALNLPPSGCALEAVLLPRAHSGPVLQGLGALGLRAGGVVAAGTAETALAARIRTPSGTATLS